MLYKIKKPTIEELKDAVIEFSRNLLTKRESEQRNINIKKGKILADPPLYTD